MAITVLNTDAGLSSKTIVNLEDAQTITGLKTFSRSPNAPYGVAAGSAVVTNLDADKVDGVDISTLSANRIPYASGASTLTNSSGFTFDGTTLTIPGQIAFPATQAASSNANTLDDYEEGSWTPTITGTGGGSGQAYTIQVARYVKIGKIVWIWGRLSLSTLGTVTTQAKLTGLPFTSASDTNLQSALDIGWFANLTTAVSSVGGFIQVGTTDAHLYYTAGAGSTSSAALTQADMANTSSFIFSGVYQAAN